MQHLRTLFMKIIRKSNPITYWYQITSGKVVRVLDFCLCRHLVRTHLKHLLLITFVQAQIIFAFHIDNPMAFVTTSDLQLLITLKLVY